MVYSIDTIPDEEFKNLIIDCGSISDALKKLGYSTVGNSWGYTKVKDRLQKMNITLVPKYTNKQFKSAQPLNQILVKDCHYNRTKLKQRLIQEGLKEAKCECCGITDWNGKELSFHLHHVNGINTDNRLSNLQILCPNCHSQTDNFGTKGKGLKVENKAKAVSVEIKEEILNTVRELGIVEARKKLPYANSFINAVVKLNRDIIIMYYNNEEYKFSTTMEAAQYTFNVLKLGKSIQSNRASISKACSGVYSKTLGLEFKRRSLIE